MNEITRLKYSLYYIVYHDWMNQFMYGSISLHSQKFYFALVRPIQRLTSTMTSIFLRVVSCTAEILSREGIIKYQWGDLNLIQVVI